MTVGAAVSTKQILHAQLDQPLERAALLQMAIIGDGFIGPMLEDRRAKSGHERTFSDSRVASWLLKLMPDVDLTEATLPDVSGNTTVDVAKRLPDLIDRFPGLRLMLISAGSEDCLAAISGGNPTAEMTVKALEHIAASLLAAGIKPVYIIPPPSMHFGNGLFADRYVAIASTIRRLQAQDKRISVIDSIALLKDKRAFGISPDPRYVSAGSDNLLTTRGAYILAEAIAQVLTVFFPQLSSVGPDRRAALNPNPFFEESGETIDTADVIGTCARAYNVRCHQLNGARIKILHRRTEQAVIFTGRYTTDWGFLKLSQDIPVTVFNAVTPGDFLEASCEIALHGAVENIASVSLHITAVWDTDFIGLHSSLYGGGPGVGEAYSGRLQTPRFKVSSPLKSLHLSLQAHLLPGVGLEASGRLDIRNMILRKSGQIASSCRMLPPNDFDGRFH